MTKYTKKDLFRLGLGFLIAIFFGVLIARQTDWPHLWRTLNSVKISWIVAALIAFVIDYFFRIARWHAMLATRHPELSMAACAGPFLASFAANNVLPFRAGDIMRAVAFNKQLGTDTVTILATLFVERLLDLLMVVTILGGVILFFDFDIKGFIGIGAGVLLLVALSILCILLFPQSVVPLIRLSQAAMKRFSPVLSQRFADQAYKGLATLISVSGRAMIFRLLGFSILCWFFEGAVFWMAALALPGISVSAGAWLALPIGTLATLIPGTPGYVGTFDYFTAKVMMLSGNDVIAATAYAFLVHILLWFPPTIVGGIYMILRSFRPSAAKKVEKYE